MNKAEFLKRLEAGLARASAEERVAALQYFTEYLDEAGPEREAEVLAELGSPEKVAANVLSVSGGEGAEPQDGGRPAPAGPPTQQALTTPPWLAAVTDVFSSLGQPPKPGGGAVYPPPPNPAPPQGDAPALPALATPGPQAGPGGYNTTNTQAAKIILIVLACIFLSPIIGGLAAALAGLLAAAVIVFLCPILIGLGLLAGGVACVALAAMLLPLAAPNGLVVLGAGIFLLGLGLMCMVGGARLLGGLLPRIIRALIDGIGRLWRKIFPRSVKNHGGVT